MMAILAEYGSVIFTSMFRLYLGLGMSFAFQQNTLERLLLIGTGSVLGVLFCLSLGKRIEKWWLNRKARTQKSRNPTLPARKSIIERIWKQYGLFGLALFSIVMGTLPSVAIALVSGLDRQKIFLYLVLGKLSWLLLVVLIGQVPF